MICQMATHIFQLTTSQGGRRLIPDCYKAVKDFNSRPRKEVDHLLMYFFAIIDISTHDLARRSTHLDVKKMYAYLAFQLTTSQGGRRIRFVLNLSILIFQLTTSQGGRHPSSYRVCRDTHFNSRPRKEVDPEHHQVADKHQYFNSRPRKEVDSNFYAKSFPFKITFCAHCI